MLSKHHPEQADDEIFLGILTHAYFENIGWKTKRQGQTVGDSAPVFVKGQEVAESVEKTTHPSIKAYYLRMVETGDGQINPTGTDQLRLVIEVTETFRDVGEDRALTGYEVKADIVPVELDGWLHENTNLGWLMPAIVNACRFVLRAAFKDQESVYSEFNIVPAGLPTDTPSIEEAMDNYESGTDVEFPAEVADPDADEWEFPTAFDQPEKPQS